MSTPTQLDYEQAIQLVTDDVNKAFQVSIVANSAPGTAQPILSGDGSGFKATVNSSGELLVHTTIAVESIEIGKVDQGNAGVQAWLVDGSAHTQPVSASSLPLPTGASTSALQTQISGQLPTSLGAKTTANSLAVNIASDQTVPVSAASLPLPTGAATSANQTTGNTSLASIDGKTPALGQALAAASVPVVLTAAQISTLTPLSSVTVTQATGTNLHTVVDSSALPTGAATAAGLTTINTTLGSPFQAGGSIGNTTFASTQSGTWNITNVSGTVSLPTGASTSALQTTGNTSVASIDTKTPALGQALAASSVPVVLTAAQLTTLTPLSSVTVTQATAASLNATVVGTGTFAVQAAQSGSWTVSESGYTNSEFVRNDYTSTAVTTAAYVQLIASTANAYQEIEIFDSSGQTLEIAFGAAASEVNKFLVFPGGNGRIRRNVPSGTRISIKAVSATASVGEIDINLYG